MKKIFMTACGVAMMSIVALAQQTDTTNIRNNAGSPQNQTTQDSARENQTIQQDSTDQSNTQGTRKHDKSSQKDGTNSSDKQRKKSSKDNPK